MSTLNNGREQKIINLIPIRGEKLFCITTKVLFKVLGAKSVIPHHLMQHFCRNLLN